MIQEKRGTKSSGSGERTPVMSSRAEKSPDYSGQDENLIHSRPVRHPARNEKTRDCNRNFYRAREKMANMTHLIFMPKSYPCYPWNPCLLQVFDPIVASVGLT
jgi:hypothetical protein